MREIRRDLMQTVDGRELTVLEEDAMLIKFSQEEREGRRDLP